MSSSNNIKAAFLIPPTRDFLRRRRRKSFITVTKIVYETLQDWLEFVHSNEFLFYIIIIGWS